MEEKDTKYIDNLSKKVIGKSTIESPSFDFTNTVMSQINALQESKSTVYKPLISKPVWFLITIGFLASSLYVLFFGTKTESSNWMQSINFSMFSNINLDILPSVSISKTFTYAVLFFGLMVCIQIPLLKNHFDKRFDV